MDRMERIIKRQFNDNKQVITSVNALVEGDNYMDSRRSVLKTKKDMAVESKGAKNIESEKRIKKEIQRLKDENISLKKRLNDLKSENDKLQKK